MNKTEIYKYYGWNPEDGDYVRDIEEKNRFNYFKKTKLLQYIRLLMNRIHKLFL